MARQSAGLSLQRVADAVGGSRSEMSRIERGQSPWVTVTALTRACAVVGLDLRLRAYPGGEPLRDIAHVRLLDGLRSLLPRTIRIRTEVPIGDARGLRAWDAVIDRGGRSCGVELEVRLVDAQALLRRLQLKRRDGSLPEVILVLADTRQNRASARAAASLFEAELPLTSATIKGTISAGAIPTESGVVFVPFGARIGVPPRESR